MDHRTDEAPDDEALLASAIAGEIELSPQELDALLARTGTTRSEFDQLRQMADDLEFRAVSEAAKAEAPGRIDVLSTLERARAESSRTRRSHRPHRPLLVGGLLAAAAALAMIALRPYDAPHDPTQPNAPRMSGNEGTVPSRLVLSDGTIELAPGSALLSASGVSYKLKRKNTEGDRWTLISTGTLADGALRFEGASGALEGAELLLVVESMRDRAELIVIPVELGR